MTPPAHDLMLDLAAWEDGDTGLKLSLSRYSEDETIVRATLDLTVGDKTTGGLMFEYLEPVLVVAIADFGPLAGQGVASRYYEWAVPVIRDFGVERLTSNPRGVAEPMLRSKGWTDNNIDSLGTLHLHLMDQPSEAN